MTKSNKYEKAIYLGAPTARVIVLNELKKGSKTHAELVKAVSKYRNKHNLDFNGIIPKLIEEGMIKKVSKKRRVYAISDNYWKQIL